MRSELRWSLALALAGAALGCGQSEDDYIEHLTVQDPEPDPPRPDRGLEVDMTRPPCDGVEPTGCDVTRGCAPRPRCVDDRWTCSPAVGAVEACNGLDDDCDGAADESLDGTCCLGPDDAQGQPPPCNGAPLGALVPDGWSYVPGGAGGPPLLVMQHELTAARWNRYTALPVPAHTGAAATAVVRGLELYDALALANSAARALALTPCYVADAPFDFPDARAADVVDFRLDPDCTGPRLPSASEFERLVAAGWPPRDPGDPCEADLLCGEAWCGRVVCGCNAVTVAPADGQRQANRYGLYDLVGNVAEWVWADAESSLPRPGVAWPVAGGSVTRNTRLTCGPPDSGAIPWTDLDVAETTENTLAWVGARLVRTYE